MVGTIEDDVLNGTNSSDVLSGKGGDDTLRGCVGNDDVWGGSGDDILFGHSLTEDGGSILQIDDSGNGGADGWTDVATLEDVTDFTVEMAYDIGAIDVF
ncbi:MAG: hypothetical protein HQ513_05745 [Rhodospirillales bacterium]|nr:hypothetical protein [Rhodospirillales bacterium]